MKIKSFTAIVIIFMLFSMIGCVIPAPNSRPWSINTEISTTPRPTTMVLPDQLKGLITLRPPDSPYLTPTPDTAHSLPAMRSNSEQYIVQYGDYLSLIADLYGISLDMLLAANPNVDPATLEVGQVLDIPAPHSETSSSDFKIIPDSELVYGPMSATLDIAAFVKQHDGYLNNYSETIEGQLLSGAEIVQRVAYEYSVNPRLLLSLLEYQSRWITQTEISASLRLYPMGYGEENHQGLYKQLCWTADQLNYAYYAWKTNSLSYVILADNRIIALSPRINAGTAAVEFILALLTSPVDYDHSISKDGLYTEYVNFFGIPFDLSIEPLLPDGLTQPELILPFESGRMWSFTSGPHGGWGSGSAWAALDFAPPGEGYGCIDSDEWVLAAADGLILRAKDGAVVQDLDGDGLEQTGWTILYMHLETRDRVTAGTYVKTGDRLGHPSCEGGFSNGTHTHLARRYNGEWIAADGNLPFNFSGWISAGDGVEYDGTLTKEGQMVIAYDGRIDENQIQR